MYSWLKSSRCWPIRWVWRERCCQTWSLYYSYSKKKQSSFLCNILSGKHISLYARHALSAVSIIKVNYSFARVSEGREKKRKELVKSDCGQNEARKEVWITKTEWKRLQSSIWKKSVSQIGENKGTKEGWYLLSSSSLLILDARLADRCEVTRVSPSPTVVRDTHEGCVTLTKTRLHLCEDIQKEDQRCLPGCIYKAGNAHTDDQERTGADFWRHLVVNV